MDHGVELTRLFHEYRFAFGLGGQATKSVLGFGGSDAHGGILKEMAILAIRRPARQGGPSAKQFDGAQSSAPEGGSCKHTQTNTIKMMS